MWQDCTADVRPVQPRQNTAVGSRSGLAAFHTSQANFDDVVGGPFSHRDNGILQVLASVARYDEPDFPKLLCTCDIPVALSRLLAPGEAHAVAACSGLWEVHLARGWLR